MHIAMLYPNNPPFYIDTHEAAGLGGSESGFVRTFHELVHLGHHVSVFNRWPLGVNTGQWRWDHIKNFNPNDRYDVVYALRHADVFDRDMPNVGLKVLFLADTESIGLGERFLRGKIDLVMAVSHWQKEKIADEEHIHDNNWMVTSNGIAQGDDLPAKYRGRCLYTGTPERALPTLLKLWPRVKQKAPWATLELFSSFMGWGESRERNEEICATEYALAKELPGVINSVHGPAPQLRLAQSLAEFYVYPTDFKETRCMSVLEAMYQQCIPIVTGRAALLEEVAHGVTGFVIPSYGADSERYQALFVETLVEKLSRPERELDEMRLNCRRYASQFTYPKLAKDWTSEWEWRLMDKGWKFV